MFGRGAWADGLDVFGRISKANGILWVFFLPVVERGGAGGETIVACADAELGEREARACEQPPPAPSLRIAGCGIQRAVSGRPLAAHRIGERCALGAGGRAGGRRRSEQWGGGRRRAGRGAGGHMRPAEGGGCEGTRAVCAGAGTGKGRAACERRRRRRRWRLE